MKDTRQEDKVRIVENIIHVLLENRHEFEEFDGVVNVNTIAKNILQAIEQVETDYHNKWEEMKCEEQYQEKNGDTL